MDVARAKAILAHIKPDGRQLAEALRSSDKFRAHCAARGVGRTWGALLDRAMSESPPDVIINPGEPETLTATRWRAVEAYVARNPWLQLRAFIEAAAAEADEKAEATALVEQPVAEAPRQPAADTTQGGKTGQIGTQTAAAIEAMAAVFFGENRTMIPAGERELARLAAERAQELGLRDADVLKPEHATMRSVAKHFIRGMSAVKAEAAKADATKTYAAEQAKTGRNNPKQS